MRAENGGAGGRFTSHPSQEARWMGHPMFLGMVEREQRQRQAQIPPLRCGMTNKRISKSKGKPPFAMKLQKVGYPATALEGKGWRE